MKTRMKTIPGPKTAFNDINTKAIEEAILRLSRRVKCTLSTPTLSYKEMLTLIAPTDQVEFLLHVREIADIGPYAARDTDAMLFTVFQKKEVRIEFGVSGDEGSPVMPRRPWIRNISETTSLITALNKSAHDFAGVAIEWGHVMTVFRVLNTICKTPAQVRYLWPSIVGIMSVNQDLDDARESIAVHTVPRTLPKIGLRLRKLCRDTSGIVATALLLPRLENEAYVVPDVRVNFVVDNNATEVEDGVFTYPVNN